MVPAYPHGRITSVLQTTTQQHYQTYRQDTYCMKVSNRKNFDRLSTWGDVWPEIYWMAYWTYRYVISAAKYRNNSLH
jgi:hypothetical protein